MTETITREKMEEAKQEVQDKMILRVNGHNAGYVWGLVEPYIALIEEWEPIVRSRATGKCLCITALAPECIPCQARKSMERFDAIRSNDR